MFTFAFLATGAHSYHLSVKPGLVKRAGTPLAQVPDIDEQQQKLERAPTPTEDKNIGWGKTSSGYKFVDEVEGSAQGLVKKGDVVKVQYTVSVLETGTKVGSSRDGWPLTFCLGKHDVPVWDEALVGMKIGGRRRLIVPPSANLGAQAAKVPGDEPRSLRFDIELVGLETNAFTKRAATAFAPFERAQLSRLVYLAVWAASFIPYFLPESAQPAIYHDGITVEEARERREARQLNNYIGGDLASIDNLFPGPSSSPE